MADNTLKVRLQSAYKSSADWDTLNPVLKNGEVGYVSSPASMYGWYKIGNGTSTWKQLPYSTYRPLNNGDFDTINVIDETAGDLIVTGAARFLNTIQGTATSAVNAGTASSASNAAKTTGTLTIKEALGTPSTPSVTFNGSANATATITVPSHTSHLTNNSGFITSGATVAAANKTTGTLTLQVAGTTKATFNGNTTTYNVTTSDLGIGTAGLKASSDFLLSTTKYAGSTSVGGAANDSAKLGGQSSTYYASTSYVNDKIANATHFMGGFEATNADALKAPAKAKGDMYVNISTSTTTFYNHTLDVGDSIIFQSSVAAGTNPTSADFIAVQGTVKVTNSGPTLAWNTVSTVGTVEGVALTVKMPANPNTNTTYTVDKVTSGVTSAYVGLHANGATTWSSTTNLATSAFVNPLINALTEGSSQASTADYILTTYVGAGTPTTTWHRRKASLVSVGYATSAGAAPYPVTDADRGLSLVSKKIGHASSYTATANISGNTSTTMSFGGSFAVPYFSIDAYGHATAVGQKTFTLPSNPNTDYRQGMNKDNTNKFYLTGTTSGSNSTATSIFSDTIYAQGTTATAPDIVSTAVNTKIANALLTGAGTAARYAGSSANPRYFPALWKMDTGRTIKDGDIVTFKIPVAGHDYGVWLSADNGANYYAIACNGTGRLTTHFPVNTYVSCIFETAGSVASVFASTGSNARITASGGCWRIINYYDSNSNDTGYYLRRIYPNLKAGSNKVFPYTIILQKPDGKWESLVKSSTTATSKAANTNGFNLTPALLMYANATYDGNIGTYNIWSMHSGLIDHRYSFNTANDATNGTTGYKPIYLTGTIGSDGLFYLNTTKWWVQDLPAAGAGTEGTIYWYIGDAYDYYRMTFVDTQKIYIYANGRIREYSDFAQYASSAANAASLGGSAASTYLQGDDVKAGSGITVSTAAGVATVSADLRTTTKLGAAGATAAATETTKIYAVQMDSNGDLAVKVPWTDTDTKVTAVGNHYTPTSSGTFSPVAGGTTTNISDTVVNIITGLQKDAAGHITSVVSGSIKADKNTDTKVTAVGNHYTPTSSGTFSPAAGGTTTDISTSILNIITGLQKDAAGHITGVVSGSIKATNTPNTDEKLKMTPASATKFYPAGGTSQTSAVSTAYFSSAVYIQGASVVATNFVGTATTASYAANAAKVNNLTVQTAVPSGAVFTDTKNTAGSTNSDSKLFLIGATSQAANPQTYSDSEVYTTNGTLTTNKVQVGGTAVTLQFNSTTKSLDFVFA